eukprot:m.46107 g.46107  ORF g.46107 m.46107 type:complete len:945 (-) comp7251_c0_seq2:997-3831(-)
MSSFFKPLFEWNDQREAYVKFRRAFATSILGVCMSICGLVVNLQPVQSLLAFTGLPFLYNEVIPKMTSYVFHGMVSSHETTTNATTTLGNILHPSLKDIFLLPNKTIPALFSGALLSSVLSENIYSPGHFLYDMRYIVIPAAAIMAITAIISVLRSPFFAPLQRAIIKHSALIVPLVGSFVFPALTYSGYMLSGSLLYYRELIFLLFSELSLTALAYSLFGTATCMNYYLLPVVPALIGFTVTHLNDPTSSLLEIVLFSLSLVGGMQFVISTAPFRHQPGYIWGDMLACLGMGYAFLLTEDKTKLAYFLLPSMASVLISLSCVFHDPLSSIFRRIFKLSYKIAVKPAFYFYVCRYSLSWVTFFYGKASLFSLQFWLIHLWLLLVSSIVTILSGEFFFDTVNSLGLRHLIRFIERSTVLRFSLLSYVTMQTLGYGSYKLDISLNEQNWFSAWPLLYVVGCLFIFSFATILGLVISPILRKFCGFPTPSSVEVDVLGMCGFASCCLYFSSQFVLREIFVPAFLLYALSLFIFDKVNGGHAIEAFWKLTLPLRRLVWDAMIFTMRVLLRLAGKLYVFMDFVQILGSFAVSYLFLSPLINRRPLSFSAVDLGYVLSSYVCLCTGTILIGIISRKNNIEEWGYKRIDDLYRAPVFVYRIIHSVLKLLWNLWKNFANIFHLLRNAVSTMLHLLWNSSFMMFIASGGFIYVVYLLYSSEHMNKETMVDFASKVPSFGSKLFLGLFGLAWHELVNIFKLLVLQSDDNLMENASFAWAFFAVSCLVSGLQLHRFVKVKVAGTPLVIQMVVAQFAPSWLPITVPILLVWAVAAIWAQSVAQREAEEVARLFEARYGQHTDRHGFQQTEAVVPDQFRLPDEDCRNSVSHVYEADGPCLICLEELGDSKPSYCIACGHQQFHKDCLQAWFLESKKTLCPLCRNPAFLGTSVLRAIM